MQRRVLVIAYDASVYGWAQRRATPLRAASERSSGCWARISSSPLRDLTPTNPGSRARGRESIKEADSLFR